MESTIFTTPCTPEEVAAGLSDCGEGQVEKWLEDEAIPGFRVWQLAAIVILFFLALVVGLCCCTRFRIPRTKQNIEADFVRKRLTHDFRRELDKINNGEMDEMDLRRAIEKVKSSLEIVESSPDRNAPSEMIEEDIKPKDSALRFMFRGLRTHLSKAPEVHSVI